MMKNSINSNNGADSNIDQRPNVMVQAPFPQSYNLKLIKLIAHDFGT